MQLLKPRGSLRRAPDAAARGMAEEGAQYAPLAGCHAEAGAAAAQGDGVKPQPGAPCGGPAPAQYAAQARRPGGWRGGLFQCCGSSTRDCHACCLSCFCAPLAFGHNMKKGLALAFVTQALLYFLYMSAFRMAASFGALQCGPPPLADFHHGGHPMPMDEMFPWAFGNPPHHGGPHHGGDHGDHGDHHHGDHPHGDYPHGHHGEPADPVVDAWAAAQLPRRARLVESTAAQVQTDAIGGRLSRAQQPLLGELQFDGEKLIASAAAARPDAAAAKAAQEPRSPLAVTTPTATSDSSYSSTADYDTSLFASSSSSSASSSSSSSEVFASELLFLPLLGLGGATPSSSDVAVAEVLFIQPGLLEPGLLDDAAFSAYIDAQSQPEASSSDDGGELALELDAFDRCMCKWRMLDLAATPLAILFLLYAGARRTQLRRRMGIPGNVLTDQAAWLCCAPCALCQETRTVAHTFPGCMCRGGQCGVASGSTTAPGQVTMVSNV